MLMIYTAYIFIQERPNPIWFSASNINCWQYNCLHVTWQCSDIKLNIHINNLSLVIHSVEILNYILLTCNLPGRHTRRSDLESYISSRQLSGRHAKRRGLELYIANQ